MRNLQGPDSGLILWHERDLADMGETSPLTQRPVLTDAGSVRRITRKNPGEQEVQSSDPKPIK